MQSLKKEGLEVMVDIMYINDLSTERRAEESGMNTAKAKNKVNYQKELDLLSSHKKGESSTRFSI